MWHRCKIFIVNFFISIDKLIIDKLYPPIQSCPIVPNLPRPSLDDLPDLCLLKVFKKLSLIELLRSIRLVNNRWSRLVYAELNSRNSLFIVDDRDFNPLDLQLDQHGSRLIEYVKRDDGLTPWARLPHIDHRNVINRNNRYKEDDPKTHSQVPREMITTLMKSLPRITKLIVVQQFFDLRALDQVIRMIDHWKDDLITLELTLTEECRNWVKDGNAIPNGYYFQLKGRTARLFASINRTPSLKHLKLVLDFYSPKLRALPILSQLRSFHSGEFDLPLLQNAFGNGQLQISIGLDSKLESDLDLLLRVDQELCGKFVGVQVWDMFQVRHGIEDDDGNGVDGDLNRMLRDMNNFCTRFTSLVHLSLHMSNMPLAMLSRSLSHLTQLVHLSLRWFDLERDVNLEDLNIVPVPSVRLISLRLHIQNHNYTERLLLPEIFPNLQVLSIVDMNCCYECRVSQNVENDEHEPYYNLRLCAQLARKPFRRCPNLHTIEIDENDTFCLSDGISKRLITRDEL